MEAIFATLRQHNINAYLVGEIARNKLRTGTWGRPGTVEVLALSTRKRIAKLPGIQLQRETPRGPLHIEVELDGHKLPGYITCVAPQGNAPFALKKALRRRGFRIEGLAVAMDGTLVDPLGVVADLEQPKIRLFHQDQRKAFEEDSLRLIGLSRLVAECKGHIDPTLKRIATEEAGRVLYAPRDGWFREMTGLLCGAHVWEGMQSLFDTRVLGFLLPEVHGMVGFAETSRYHHKDLWDHTRQVIDQAEPLPLVRWAALLHDVGKLWTRTYGKKGEVHFYQHDELGAVLVESIGPRLAMPVDFQESLAFLVRHHLRPNAYLSSWTDAAVRRLMTESGDRLTALLQLSRADMTSGQKHKRQKAARLSAELKQRITEIRRKDEQRTVLPKGLGAEIISRFSLTPGPRVGRIRRSLEESVMAGRLEPRQPCDYYLDYLQQQTLPE